MSNGGDSQQFFADNNSGSKGGALSETEIDRTQSVEREQSQSPGDPMQVDGDVPGGDGDAGNSSDSNGGALSERSHQVPWLRSGRSRSHSPTPDPGRLYRALTPGYEHYDTGAAGDSNTTWEKKARDDRRRVDEQNARNERNERESVHRESDVKQKQFKNQSENKIRQPVDLLPSEQVVAKQDRGINSKLGVIFAIWVAIVCANYFFGDEDGNNQLPNQPADSYKNRMLGIQKDFSNQDERLWRIVKVAMNEHYLTENNIEPAILMLASDTSAIATTECLALRLAHAYSHKCRNQTGEVEGSNLHGKTYHKAKLEIDNQMIQSFEQGTCAMVVSRFEEIPAAATTIFYQFCENDNAPYKDVAIIFTVLMNDLSSVSPKLWDKTVQDFVVRSLHERDPDTMTYDMIGGLMSRITPLVGVVKHDNVKNCKIGQS